MSSKPVYEVTCDYPELAYSHAFLFSLSGLSRNSLKVDSDMSNIALDRVHDLIDMTGKHQFPQSQSESHDHSRLDMGGQ